MLQNKKNRCRDSFTFVQQISSQIDFVFVICNDIRIKLMRKRRIVRFWGKNGKSLTPTKHKYKKKKRIKKRKKIGRTGKHTRENRGCGD